MQFYGGIAGPWKRHEPVSVRTAVIDWHSARQTEKGIKKTSVWANHSPYKYHYISRLSSLRAIIPIVSRNKIRQRLLEIWQPDVRFCLLFCLVYVKAPSDQVSSARNCEDIREMKEMRIYWLTFDRSISQIHDF